MPASRVLYVESSMGGVVGGSLTGVYHLVRGLDPTRFDFTIALYEEKLLGPGLEQLEGRVGLISGMRRTRSGRLPRRALNLATVIVPNAFRLARFISGWRPSIVHACNGFRANLDLELACLMTGVPCVCHVKGFAKLQPLERFFASKTAGVIWMTDALEGFYAAQGVRPAFSRTIYDGLDLEHFTPRRDAGSVGLELGLRPGVPTVAVAGNIQSWKGQHVVVKAVALLKDRFPDLCCLIVGGVHRSGRQYHDELKRLVAELGIEKRVVFTGFRRDVASLLGATDIVIHSSIKPEPFGRVIIEGMSLGKPVVAAAAGGVMEIITTGTDGLLVTPGDADSLAQAIAGLLTDPAAARRLGEEGKKTVARRFSLSRYVGEVEDFYGSLLERIPASRARRSRHDLAGGSRKVSRILRRALAAAWLVWMVAVYGRYLFGYKQLFSRGFGLLSG